MHKPRRTSLRSIWPQTTSTNYPMRLWKWSPTQVTRSPMIVSRFLRDMCSTTRVRVTLSRRHSTTEFGVREKYYFIRRCFFFKSLSRCVTVTRGGVMRGWNFSGAWHGPEKKNSPPDNRVRWAQCTKRNPLEPIENTQKTNICLSFLRRFWIFRGSPKIMKTCKNMYFSCAFAAFDCFLKSIAAWILFFKSGKRDSGPGGGYNLPIWRCHAAWQAFEKKPPPNCL